MAYKEKICGIYCIKNIINNKVYIGQSTHILQRFNVHKHHLNKNNHCNIHLQRAWNKYSKDNFEFFILEVSSPLELDRKEKEYISKYNSYKKGYNRDLGGKYDGHKSQETIIKLKKSKENISDDIRDNMRKSHDSIPIYQIDFNGDIINEWYGAREASKKLNINQPCIWICINKNRKTYKNSIWISKSEYHEKGFNISDYIGKTNPKPKNIIQLDLDYIYIKSWDSITNIKNILGFRPGSIIDCCKQRIDSYKGFKWVYKEDYDKLIV